MRQEYVIIISSSEGLNPKTSQYDIRGFVGMKDQKLTRVNALDEACRFDSLNVGRGTRNKIHSTFPGNKFIVARIKDGSVQQKLILA